MSQPKSKADGQEPGIGETGRAHAPRASVGASPTETAVQPAAQSNSFSERPFAGAAGISRKPEMNIMTQKASKPRASPASRETACASAPHSHSPSVLSVTTFRASEQPWATYLWRAWEAKFVVKIHCWRLRSLPLLCAFENCNLLQLHAVSCAYLLAHISPYFPIVPSISHRECFSHELATLPYARFSPPSALLWSRGLWSRGPWYCIRLRRATECSDAPGAPPCLLLTSTLRRLILHS